MRTNIHVASATVIGGSLLYASIAAAAVAATVPTSGPHAAHKSATVANAPSTQVLHEVVVSGYRSSLAAAIDLKRAMAGEADSILADDVGKFPNQNLAEALQQVPGVAITEQEGEGRQITVRGLSPIFTSVRIDGMPALATTGGPDNYGGVNRSQAFDFNTFSADLFNRMTVRKTAEARIPEGSLGATVDLHTAHPFDYNHFVFVTDAKGDYNTLAGSTGPQLSALISNVFDGGKFGALASVSWQRRDYIDTGDSTVRWEAGQNLKTGSNVDGPSPYGFASVLGTPCVGTASTLPSVCQQADSALHPRFPRYDYFQNSENRLGMTASLQWRPNSNNLFSLDVLHSYYHETRQEQYLEAPGLSGQGGCSNPASSVSIGCINVLSENINSQGVMVSGTFSGVDTRVEDRFDSMHTNFTQITLRGTHRLNRRWRMDELIGYSDSRFVNNIQTTLGWDQYNQTVSYNFATRVPQLNFGNENVGLTGPWLLTEVRLRPQTDDNSYKTAEINLHFRPNRSINFDGGVQYKEYDFRTTSLRLVNGESVNSSNAYAALQSTPIASYGQTLNFASAGTDAPAGSTMIWATPSVAQAAGLFGLYSNSLFALSTKGDLGNNKYVRERDFGGYLQMNFRTKLLSRVLRGNIGFRVVRTNQYSLGYSSSLTPIGATHNYDNVLPALNLTWSLRRDLLLRFAVSRDMTRPNMTDVTDNTSISVSGTQFAVKTGDPNLQPYLANAYDLSLEWYPLPGTLVAIAPFRKDLLTTVASETINTTFSSNPFGLPDSLAIAACGSTPGCSPSATWKFSAPGNTQGGELDGVEFDYQEPLRFLPGLLKNLGVLVNYTYVTSNVQYPAGGGTYISQELLGLSKNTANATLYYEDHTWSVRLSGAYRSPYLISVPGSEPGTSADGWDGTFYLSASVEYNVNAHLRLMAQAENLTDQYESEFDGISRNLVYYYHHTGRDILVGFRYKY